MTITDAARCLGRSKDWVAETLSTHGLSYSKSNKEIYFGHETARALFQFSFVPRVIAFHIVKGGTGKTSLVYEFAVRASLYGANVLCVDMDQQGNLTEAFQANAEAQERPVMIDVLADDVPLEDCILAVAPGIDLLPSRFENAMLDEIIRAKGLGIEKVYREPFQRLKNRYDLIVIDCPPSLGLSVAAIALSSDYLVAPVTPEKFALSGLELAYQSMTELQMLHNIPIRFGIVFNKIETRTTLSQLTLKFLLKHSKFADLLLKRSVRFSQEFPNAIASRGSVFDAVRTTAAKEDIDALAQQLLGIISNVSLQAKGCLDARLKIKEATV
ncbi:MAG TPA: ParA family protein [Gammaproteobacteria bacterium]|nr:ParA family protein [Gammaproteobacteria bacterium]